MNNVDLYNKYIELKEENKLDSKYAELINIFIYIIGICIFFILIKYIMFVKALSVLCLYYLITKLLNFMMFGTRLKRRKQRQFIKNSIKNLKF